MGRNRLQKHRHFLTVRLLEDDHQLLREVGKKRGLAKYEALQEVAKLVPNLKLPEKPLRRPIRIGLPPELYEALQEKKKATGEPILTILLVACRQYVETAPQQ